jgi:hypothetical protein
LQTAIFPISVQGNIRFEVRKITGTGIRINIDDLSITATMVEVLEALVLVALVTI